MARSGVSRARLVFTAALTLASLVLVALHHSLFVTGCGVAGVVSGVAFMAFAQRR
jgi:hypothetical protein